MAPIHGAAVGVSPQTIEDDRLRNLRESLLAIEVEETFLRHFTSPDQVTEPFDIGRLVSALEPWQSWVFEEQVRAKSLSGRLGEKLSGLTNCVRSNPYQVDLHEWIDPLNKIDAALSYFIQKYPSLLLIGPVKRKKSRGAHKEPDQLVSLPAASVEDVNTVPDSIAQSIAILIRFLSGLLGNSSNKSVFNSVEELVDLLATADDTIASLALEALCSLATPPSIHKQPPEVQQHTTALHNSKTTSHKRLIALARGWGSRGSGLGLHSCTTADDSEFGQGALPPQAGELSFAFFQSSTNEAANENGGDQEDCDVDELDESRLVRIQLLGSEIVEDGGMHSDALKTGNESDQKRRRVAPATLGERKLRSTAELFFMCIDKAGGRKCIPNDRLFPLLADIRLTRAFHSRLTRVAAVERRLRALITILHSHPSQEILSGYFQAQPELCVELIDMLRPTVSSASVSAAAANPGAKAAQLRQDGISALANSPGVPYQVRKLAVDALTALVARRDGTSGALTGVARHSSVLSELGVGKGQYLGLLPTLIRYSLASLGSFLTSRGDSNPEPLAPFEPEAGSDAIGFDVGLVFVEATMPPQLPRVVQLERALEFVDSVLTLTSAVVSSPSGTSALTDCGLIPALLTTVDVDTHAVVERLVSRSSSVSQIDMLRIKSLLRFITAQAVQILEGAIVTHNNALSAFHDLQGVEILTTRLSKEILGLKHANKKTEEPGTEIVPMDCDVAPGEDHKEMDVDMSPQKVEGLRSSQRVLLFSIVTCLTVVFHQESTSSSVATPAGAAQLRKPELTEALIEIMENVDAYGGHLASLIATLMSDVMNSDPHVVHHVHQTGLGQSFIKMLVGGPEDDPALPAVPELIMAVPNVLSALSLTEDGAKAVKEANPFPAILRIFHHPKYAMPKSRCLLNEMTAIVGTGLDEIMRHVQSLRQLVLDAIAEAMNNVADFGEELAAKETRQGCLNTAMDMPASEMENERSCLMQYALNFGQLLEQILHNEDHCEPFVAAGGLDALLRLYPCLMPAGTQFLANVSCLSCPSVSTLAHSTTEDSLTLAFKCVALRYDSSKLVQKMIETTNLHIDKLEEHQMALRRCYREGANSSADRLDAGLILDGLPREPIYSVNDEEFAPTALALSLYLRQVASLQWMTSLLSAAIKAACQRSQETGTGWSRSEREWKKELSSTSFKELLNRLSRFHQSAIYEVCRIRTEDGYEDRYKKRLLANNSNQLRYRLRIVCPEGAVVRDGIEIDSCASVGSMEMGEIADAFDRCINSSGVLRYRTRRGWVSEQTRGHGREPIAEVLGLCKSENTLVVPDEKLAEGRVEITVPDICNAGANVLARVQTSYAELFASLTRVVIQGVRSFPVRSISFQQGTIGSHIATVMKLLSSEIKNGFNRKEVVAAVNGSAASDGAPSINDTGVAMYFGCLLSHLHSCLFEEKRERRMVNVPLLIVLAKSHVSKSQDVGQPGNADVTFLDGMQYILRQGLVDFEFRAVEVSSRCQNEMDSTGKTKPVQRLSRTVAASLPPSIALLRRLISGPSITSSPVSSVLSRVKESDLAKLLGESESECSKEEHSDENFSPERLTRTLHCLVSDCIMDTWVDPKFVHAPPHIIHPVATLVGEVVAGLQDAAKKVPTTPERARDDPGLWNPFRGIVMGQRAREGSSIARAEEEFEPSEEAISRLMEMGFVREHALDALENTRSNRLEIAMEYALSHAPPSPSTVERRQAEREERRRQREEQSGSNRGSNSGGTQGNNEAPGASNEGGDSQVNAAGNSSEAMDIDAPSAESEKEKPVQDETVSKAKSYLELWKKEAVRVSCNILSGTTETDDLSTSNPIRSDSGTGEGDGEVEALTVVLCSFLLEFCQRFPEQRDSIFKDLLLRLKAHIVEQKQGDVVEYAVRRGRESSFSALCHAAVLFTRALPKARTLVLKEGLVHRIVSCIQEFLRTFAERGDKKKNEEDMVDESAACSVSWDMWLAPALLFLDIMAQPVVAFPDDDGVEPNSDCAPPPSGMQVEFLKTREEHKSQAAALSLLAQDLFSKLHGNISAQTPGGSKEDKSGEGDASGRTSHTHIATADEDGEKEPGKAASASEDDLPFKSVPAYFPLIPHESTEACAEICLTLLGQRSPAPPPGVVHATLLLLTRILRSPKMSAFCLKSGAAEKLLSLPRECRFTGHSGVVTLVLRRLLEDEQTLQAAMETEIRSTVTKLHGKQKSQSGDREKPRVSRRAFVQAITPLLCRDPVSFLKAVAVTAHFEKAPSGSSSEAKVTLLSQSERTRNMKILSDLLKPKASHIPSVKTPIQRRSSGSARHKRLSGSNPRSKTPSRANKRGATPKKNKKEKSDAKDKSDECHNGKPIVLNGSPANHVTSLLLTQVIASSSSPPGAKDTSSPNANGDDDFGFSNSFLWIANLLEVLADLVLAVPACAAAIHKYRLSRSKDRGGRGPAVVSVSHALLGCPNPPKTFVSYLLHRLLPQDRWTSKKDSQLWSQKTDEDSEESRRVEDKKRAAFRRTKMAQTSARILVALVARPGEGRRRVVAELAFALSGGRLGHSSAAACHMITANERSRASELHALQAWGELCIGLAAPRSNGSNYDGNATLSFEVVKIMLEVGMVHALLVAIHRVPLHYPMATTVCGSLILPFEILSRTSVADAVKTIVEEKESANKEAKNVSNALKDGADPSDQAMAGTQQGDSAGEDHILEDAFAEDVRDHTVDHSLDEGFVVSEDRRHADEHNEFIDDDGHHEEDEDAEGAENEMEIEDDDEDDEDDSDDEEMSSSDEESDSTSDVDDSDEDDDEEEEEDDEDGGSIIDDSDAVGSADGLGQEDFNVDHNEDMVVDNNDYEGGEESGTERLETALDEGWTRIESSGFGGIVLGARRGGGLTAGGGNMTARTRGFIDAAEAMIGTLLRTGEIQGDALAELEGSLGIRIMQNGRGTASFEGGIRSEGGIGELLGVRQGGADGTDQARRGDVVGTLPQIQQRSQPEVGHSALGGGGRWTEISSMEYVFGGPSVTSGSRNYDLISPLPAQDQNDSHPAVSPFDGQLFPGGPASAAHSRTQHSLHPLLCGVDLPPVNALVSDLLPHGVRATRRGQMATRRPGDWTNSSFPNGGFLVSTSQGHIVRSNRSGNSGPLSMMASPRGSLGPVGWTDDGLPFDASVEQFSSAFERALGNSMATPVEARVSGTADTPRDEGGEASGSGGTGVAAATRASEDDAAGAEESQNQEDAQMNTSSSAGDEPDGAANSSSVDGAHGEVQGTATEENHRNDEANDDGVATSLAAGLRLSPGSDRSVDQGASGAVASSDADTHMEAAPGSVQDQPTEPAVEDSSTMEVQQESSTANADQVDASDPSGDVTSLAGDTTTAAGENEPNGNGLVCPPGMDLEVFNSLPFEMQQEVIEQARTASELAAQLDAGSSLDPEALAALPEEMRREVIEQEQHERRLREQAPADPSNAEEMDNASFVASLAPDLRNEILLTADDQFLQSLPPNIIAEAQILRERASAERRIFDDTGAGSANRDATNAGNAGSGESNQRNSHGSGGREQGDSSGVASSRRKQRSGKLRVESNRDQIVYLPPGGPVHLSSPVAKTDVKALLRLMYLLSPIRPHRLIQKVFQNLCVDPNLRNVLSSTFVKLLHDDNKGALATLDKLESFYAESDDWRKIMDDQFSTLMNDFPPPFLIGAAPEVLDTDGLNPSITLLRRKQTSDTAASIAANLPMSAKGSRQDQYLPPVVATRIVDTLQHLCKNSPRFCLDTLMQGVIEESNSNDDVSSTCFEKLLDLLEKPRYSKSSANLEQLLILLELAVSPLSHLSKHGEDDIEVSQKDIDAAAAGGKEWVDVPRIVVSQERLQLLCSILRMETCRDVAFTKVNTIVRRLCRIDANRGYVLAELASVAHALGADAVRDLKALNIRMSDAVAINKQQQPNDIETSEPEGLSNPRKRSPIMKGNASSSVAVSTSTSELKLLRVLQTLQALCADTSDEAKKNVETPAVTEELVHLLSAMNLDDLWEELTACLKVVQVLEGVKSLDDEEEKKLDDAAVSNDGDDENGSGGKKLQNGVAGLLTRFLPSIEAFFVANIGTNVEKSGKDQEEVGSPAPLEKKGKGDTSTSSTSFGNADGGNRLVEFVSSNKVLLNALVRNNPGLLDKGLRALVQVPRCRMLLDFDVKRHWFKTQVRRLRQHASRRHGSLRLHIRRKHVFEDAYHQLRLRNADEMRGRLHITFRNEEGVDAGGLSREFFGILAKEIFNPNYALFTSTEDGCTFQPNPNSNINPDHLSYFRFVGRIVGKAVADGYLLDAHFTRSLYKHMLGIKVSFALPLFSIMFWYMVLTADIQFPFAANTS